MLDSIFLTLCGLLFSAYSAFKLASFLYEFWKKQYKKKHPIWKLEMIPESIECDKGDDKGDDKNKKPSCLAKWDYVCPSGQTCQASDRPTDGPFLRPCPESYCTQSNSKQETQKGQNYALPARALATPSLATRIRMKHSQPLLQRTKDQESLMQSPFDAYDNEQAERVKRHQQANDLAINHTNLRDRKQQHFEHVSVFPVAI